MLTVQQKLEHLRTLGIDGNLSEIEKMYEGKEFDIHDSEYKKLLELSKKYCIRFTELSSLISKAQTQEEKDAYNQEKNDILDKLFPGHGPIFGGGDGLYAIIGTVDLDGYNYINARVHFNASSLVHLEDYVFVASNVEFGTNNITSKLGKIKIGKDTWVGANVKFDDYTNVGQRSVIGMGSHIVRSTNLAPNMILFGEPCREYKTISENYETLVKQPGREGKRTDDEIKNILAHLKELGIEGDFSQYIRAIKYKKYNTLEPTISKIYELSHKLCSEYNSKDISIRRRKTILDALFPLQGKNLVMGNDIFVDCIGTVKIGNDVKIGNSPTLAGNITIGDNVKIGNNVALQTTGHEIYYKWRKITSDKNGSLCEISTPGYIIVFPELILADGTKVIPDQTLRRNTHKDETITHSR